MTSLPDVIYIGAADYAVRINKKMDVLGETFATDSRIDIKPKQSASSMRDTILHEVIHAIFWESGWRSIADLDEKSEEQIVRSITPWLLQLIRDNPDLVTFLLEK